MRRVILVSVAACVVVGVGAAVALADASGGGRTSLGNTLGFNVKNDGTGHPTYVADPKGPNAGFKVKCRNYLSDEGAIIGGDPTVMVTAECTDQDGNPIFLDATFVDRGEPGTNDEACLTFTYDPNGSPYLVDCGIMTSGNIQVRAPSQTSRRSVFLVR